MKTYRRILLASFSACPSVSQLAQCRDLAAQGDCKVRVAQFEGRNDVFESDGPAGIFPQDEMVRRRIADARQRLGLLLERGGLGWVSSSVQMGEPKDLLARELKTWRPDLVIVTRGWGHARRVLHAARQAGVPVPEVMAVAPDHLLRKVLNALLPLSAGILRFPPANFDDSFHGGHHHAAG